MTLHKICLCKTTAVLTCFSESQFSEFNKILVKNRKCRLYINRQHTEIIYICEGCRVFLEEKYFEIFAFDELRKCLIEKFFKKSQPVFLPEILARII